jgi:hypothetical protein
MSVKGMLLPIVLAAVVILAGGAIPSNAAHAPTSSLGPTLGAAPPVGPEVRISTPSSPFDPDRDWPAIAYNYQHHEYLVLWFNRWTANLDIYAQRVSDSGQLVGPWFAVSYGVGNRFNPSVAYNATNDEYLVIWSLEVASNVYEVWGRRIKWDGSIMYAEFKIFSWANRSFVVPRVAWNSYRNDYLVVWSAYDTETPPFPFTDVAGIRVLADGSMPDPHFIISTLGEPHEVDIVYNVALDGYMVVWVRGGGVSNNDIYGAFLDRYGVMISSPGEFAVNSDLSDQATPAVTTNEQNHYLVVWQHYYSSGGGDWDIYGELLQANGSVVDGPFVVANTFYDETYPEVAANGANQEYLIVWHGQTDSQDVVSARLRNADGILEPPADVSSLQLVYPWPVVACDIPGFLIVYKNTSGDCTDPQHIYGRKWLPEEVYVPLALRKCTQ